MVRNVSSRETAPDSPSDVASEFEVPPVLVYAPDLKASVRNERKIGWSETTRLMAVAAIEPFLFCQADIVKLTGASPTSVSRITSRLADELNWIDQLVQPAYRPGHPAYNLFATYEFWRDRATIMTAASAIPDKHLRAYEEAQAAFAADFNDPNAMQGNPNFSIRGHWLGLVAVLGTKYNLADYGVWEEGVAGWDLLLRTSVPVQRIEPDAANPRSHVT